MTPVRLGLIGAGSARSWAARAHLPALRAVSDVEIVAVATTRAESAREAARLTGARLAFTDGRELAEHPDVDAVAVVVKVPAHHALVAAALDAGKHVFCEWPLGTDLAQARELQDRADRAGVVHMIGLQGRQSPQLRTVRDLIADGLIGRVLSCDLRHSTGHRGGATVAAEAVWGLNRRMGRHLLTIQGGHSLDALCFILGLDFDRVCAVVTTRTPVATVIETGQEIPVDTPDQVVVAGQLTGGALAAVHLQGGAPALAGFCLDIHGDRGALRLSGEGAHNSEVVMTSVIDGVTEAVPVSPRYLDPMPANPVGNVARQYAALAASIYSGQMTGPTFADAVAIHELLHAIQEASDTGELRRVGP
jgi:predicted dehydrogenase